jgi:hypothetical protein
MRGGKREGAGRPPLTNEPTVKVSVRLPESVAAQLKQAGNGNISEGVRTMTVEHTKWIEENKALAHAHGHPTPIEFLEQFAAHHPDNALAGEAAHGHDRGHLLYAVSLMELVEYLARAKRYWELQLPKPGKAEQAQHFLAEIDQIWDDLEQYQQFYQMR